MGKITITLLTTFTLVVTTLTLCAQTVIKERRIKFQRKNYNECYTVKWNFKIPRISKLSKFDIRNEVNDSISKIANSILADTLSYKVKNSKHLSKDCDTTSNEFTNPDSLTMYYLIAQNTERFLSFEIFIDMISGGIGNGFSTEYYSFNLSILDNHLLTIDSLIDSKNFEKLHEWLNKNIESGKIDGPPEGVETGEGFNIFGQTGDDGFNSLKYVGFVVQKQFFILSYTYDYGRGKGIYQIKLPLLGVKMFIKKEYLWLCENN